MSIDIFLTEEQRMARDTVRRVVEKEIAPHRLEWDEAEQLPEGIFKKVGDIGFLGQSFPVEYGGSFSDYVSMALGAEEMGRGCAGIGTAIGASGFLFGCPLSRHGTEEQKKKYLPRLAKGEIVGCMGLTEPEHGSDALNPSTRAVADGDDWIINGSKTFISNAPIADVALIWANTEKGLTGFILEKEFEGFDRSEKFKKAGLRASPTGMLHFDDCRVPSSCILGGKPGQGIGQIFDGLDIERLQWSALAVGVAQAAFEESTRYSQERKQFGKPIAAFQHVQRMLTDMATNIHAARLMNYHAALMLDAGKSINLEVSYSKLFACEMVMKVCADAVQIHGGYGYMREYLVEKLLRDARIFAIGAGTSEVQRVIIAQYLR